MKLGETFLSASLSLALSPCFFPLPIQARDKPEHNTYRVLMFLRLAKVPLPKDLMLLSYRDKSVRLERSRNKSVRMHDISFAFSNLQEEKKKGEIQQTSWFAGRQTEERKFSFCFRPSPARKFDEAIVKEPRGGGARRDKSTGRQLVPGE